MVLTRALPGIGALVLLSSCISSDYGPVGTTHETSTAPSRTSSTNWLEETSKSKSSAPKPATSSSSSNSNVRTSPLSSAEIARLSDASRPHLPFFGAMIFADQIDFLNGTATGDVFIDGSAMNASSQEFPKYVRANKVVVDLANEKATLSGYPRLEWPQAHLRATSASTTIYLSRTKYKVEGPAQYGLGL